jgi:hypothetical protein
VNSTLQRSFFQFINAKKVGFSHLRKKKDFPFPKNQKEYRATSFLGFKKILIG